MTIRIAANQELADLMYGIVKRADSSNGELSLHVWENSAYAYIQLIDRRGLIVDVLAVSI